ncbi:MAG: DoxX family protein [Ancalomicrobiaceae bacterium]|nr:DoxX family protein [Ancalomicrobiaceae bacterium]
MLTLPAPAVNALQLAGRIIFAYIFITSGFGKLMGHDAAVGYIASGHLPIPTEFAYWGSVIVELGGGLAIALGLFTRIAAIAVAVFTVIAGYYFHLPYAHVEGLVGVLQGIHFVKNWTIAGGALFIAASGAGAWSLDRLIFGARA